jgi:hypothetical protein
LISSNASFSCFEDFLDFGFLKVKNPGLNLRNGVFVCPESWLFPSGLRMNNHSMLKDAFVVFFDTT